MTFVELLQNLDSACPLFPNRLARVITISKNATIPEALQSMIDHHIKALVVVDPKTDVACCAITIVDILDHLLNNFAPQDFANYEIFKLTQTKEHITKQSISDIQEIAELDPAVSVRQNASLLDVVDIMVKNKAHRVLVTNEDGKIVNLITQSRINDIMSCVLESIPEASQTIEELDIIVRHPVKINESKKALEAFHLMKHHNISGLPVVNDEDELVGSISVDDIKQLGYDIRYFQMLSATVAQYLHSIRMSNTREQEQIADTMILRPDVISCRVSTPLGHVMKMLSFYDVHRIFVQDENKKLIGVVSLYDILRGLLQQRK